MKIAFTSFLLILIIASSSCHFEKRHYRKGFYIHRNNLEKIISSAESETLENPNNDLLKSKTKEEYHIDSTNSSITGFENKITQNPKTDLAISKSMFHATKNIRVFNFEKEHIKLTKNRQDNKLINESVTSLTIDRKETTENEKIKWYEIVLIVILVAMGLACFGAIIVFAAETPLLVGILLIIPGIFIFGQSGDGGIVFSLIWGSLYILSYFLLFPKASYLVMIIFGIISMLVSMLIGFLIEDNSK